MIETDPNTGRDTIFLSDLIPVEEDEDLDDEEWEEDDEEDDEDEEDEEK